LAAVTLIERTGKDFPNVWKQRSGTGFPHIERWRTNAPMDGKLMEVVCLQSQLVLVNLVVHAARCDPEKAGYLRLIAMGFMQSDFDQQPFAIFKGSCEIPSIEV
jgi:hypothetical protein